MHVSSVHEPVPLPGAAAYSLAPGEIATPMTGQHDVDPAEQDTPGIPWGRPGRAFEMATTVAFLVSEGACSITGASLVADGGLTPTAAVG